MPFILTVVPRSYEDAGYRPSKLSKMTFLLNGKPVDALALIVHKSAEDEVGRAWVKKLCV